MKHTFRYTIGRALDSGEAIELDQADSHHLARIVRRAPGDPVEICDGVGRIWPAVVEEAGPPVVLRVGQEARAAPATVPVHLYVGEIDAGRLDLLVEKATEIGVARIILVTCERGRNRAGQAELDRRRPRLGRLVEAASRQSGRAGGPSIRGLVPFAVVIGELRAEPAFLVDPRGERGLGEALRAAHAATASILVGPEAGFSEAEVRLARSGGLSVCRLGDAMLRAETAAVAAVTLAADALGHLGAGG